MRLRFTFCLVFIAALFLKTDSQLQAQEAQQEFVLLEVFTNTYCPTCIFDMPDFDAEILVPFEDVDIYHVRYHVSWPIADDVFFLHNVAESEERVGYYGISGTPSLVVQGELQGYQDGMITAEQLADFTGGESDLLLDLSEYELDAGGRQVNLTVGNAGDAGSGNLRLRLIVVEKAITYEPPYDGMLETHFDVFRQTLSAWGWSGLPFSAPLPGVETTFTFEYDLDAAWSEDQIYVLAFVQNESTGEILNVASSWGNLSPEPEEPEEPVDPPVGLDELEETAVSMNLTALGDQLQLAFHSEKAKQGVAFELYDAQGRLLKQELIQTTQANINTQDLAAGMYIARLQVGDEVLVQKFWRR